MPGIASLRAFNTSTSDYLIAPVTFIHLKNKLKKKKRKKNLVG